MTFIRVDAKRIVIFAGYNRDARRRVNEVHILDISIWVGVPNCCGHVLLIR